MIDSQKKLEDQKEKENIRSTAPLTEVKKKETEKDKNTTPPKVTLITAT